MLKSALVPSIAFALITLVLFIVAAVVSGVSGAIISTFTSPGISSLADMTQVGFLILFVLILVVLSFINGIVSAWSYFRDALSDFVNSILIGIISSFEYSLFLTFSQILLMLVFILLSFLTTGLANVIIGLVTLIPMCLMFALMFIFSFVVTLTITILPAVFGAILGGFLFGKKRK